MVSSIIRKIQKDYQDEKSCLTLVLPYDTAEYRDNFSAFEDHYQNIEVFSSYQSVHFKSAITKRNEYMVDKSDLVVFYVERKSGGAYNTYRYAVTHNKKIILLNT